MKNKITFLILPLILLGCFNKTNTSTISSSSSYVSPSSSVEEPEETGYKDVAVPSYKSMYTTLMPTTGKVTPVMFLVDFVDIIGSEEEIARTQAAFNGPIEQTAWTSVKEFYHISSYGLLDFDFEVPSEFHTMRHESSYYDEAGGPDLIRELIEDSDPDYLQQDKFDSDNDGYIDAVIIIYTHPADRSTYWWAFAYIELDITVGKKKITNLFSASTELSDGTKMFCEDYFVIPVDNPNICSYTDGYLNAEASTYIHELGHLMGLFDYYDDDSSNGDSGGLGGIDAMDIGFGDHNAWSKMVLGWTKVTWLYAKRTELQLYGLINSPQAVVVGTSGGYQVDTDFYVIEFYEITKMNKFTYLTDEEYDYSIYYTKPGLIIYHLNLGGSYEYVTNNNSNTQNKLIEIVEADNDNSISSLVSSCSTAFNACDKDIFTSVGTYQLSTDLSNGYNGKFDFIIDISAIYEDHADFSITFLP
jgi:M6 family metalloprotease-like protein